MISSLPETLIAKLQKEHQESQCYSADSLKELLKEIIKTFGPVIGPITKEEAILRVTNFDNMQQWFGILQMYNQKLDQQNQMMIMQRVQGAGLDIGVYQGSISKYITNPEFSGYIQRCVADVKQNAGEPPKDMTSDQYKDCLKAQIEYLTTSKNDLEMLKKVPPVFRRRFTETRAIDFSDKKFGYNSRDLTNFVLKNEEAFKSDKELSELKEKLATILEELCVDVSMMSEEKFKAIVKSQEENAGVYTFDVLMRIMTEVDVVVSENYDALSEKEKVERREKFESPLEWYAVIKKYEQEKDESSRTIREEFLKEKGFSLPVWEKSFVIYENQALMKLEEQEVTKKMAALKLSKPVDKEGYAQFLEAQLEFCEKHLTGLMDLPNAGNLIQKRSFDFCAIKTGKEAENYHTPEAMQLAMTDPVLGQKMMQINMKMMSAAQMLKMKQMQAHMQMQAQLNTQGQVKQENQPKPDDKNK